MNIAMLSPDEKEYYLVSVKREDESFCALCKCVCVDGELRDLGGRFLFPTQRDAERKCRQLAKTKTKRRGFHEVDLPEIPLDVQEHLEVPVEMQISPQEMVKLITRSKMERYVVFKNLDGLDDYFDLGVEYLGYEVDDGFLEVHDKFGDLRHCFASRMSSVVHTERCAEVGG